MLGLAVTPDGKTLVSCGSDRTVRVWDVGSAKQLRVLQGHRAEVSRLLVHPGFRRRGLARALMRRVEAEAAAEGRSLLTLHTRAGDAAEPLYRDLGWQEGGRIPGYTVDADGTARDAVFFWKRVAPPSR